MHCSTLQHAATHCNTRMHLLFIWHSNICHSDFPLSNAYAYMYIYNYIYICVCVYIYIYITILVFYCRLLHDTGWRRPIECLVFAGRFPQKSYTIYGWCAERDLQDKAFNGSAPACTVVFTPTMYMCTHKCTNIHIHNYICIRICMCTWI